VVRGNGNGRKYSFIPLLFFMSTMNTKEKESRRIRWAKKRLENLGFYVMLSRASLGPFDLMAMNTNGVILIQVKCNNQPDAAERETITWFNKCPLGTVKQVWCFFDGRIDPEIKNY